MHDILALKLSSVGPMRALTKTTFQAFHHISAINEEATIIALD